MNNEDEQQRPIDWMVRSRLTGLAGLVVGGASAIGEAIARTFAANGGAVAIADLREDAATRVAAEIASQGGKAIAVRMDVGVQQDIDTAVAKTVAELGRLDVLISAAALVKPGKLEDCPLDDWAASFHVNVAGALMLARSCLPHLRKSPWPAIVTIGSLGGITGRPNGGSYGPSKAALIALSRQMAMEWAPYGVRVNVVNPGTIDTPMARATLPPELVQRREALIPLGRLGLPGELADLVVFLASPAASYITAQAFNCDGGHSQTLMNAPMGR